MPNKNAYLAKQAERETTIMMWGIQLAFDAMTLVLNDPEVMGKDVFGEKRFNGACRGTEDCEDEWAEACILRWLKAPAKEDA